MAMTGRQTDIDRWLEWVGEFWRQHTAPEGLTLEAENDGPHRPDCPGGKQPFTVKPWHVAFVTAIGGVDFDFGGLTIGPGYDAPTIIENVTFQGRKVSIEAKGSGQWISRVFVNGLPLGGSCKIPDDFCPAQTLRIEIERAADPPSRPMVLSADGASISSLSADSQSVRLRVLCPGSARLRFYSPRQPAVTWNGAGVEANYEQATGIGSVLLTSDDGRLDGEASIAATGQAIFHGRFSR